MSIFCFGQSSLDKKAIKLVSKAEDAIKERNFELGTELLLDAIGRDSTYADAYVKLFGLYNILRQSSKIHEFQLLYVKNVDEKALKLQIWKSLAYHEMTIGEYVRAKNFLAKAAKKDSVLSNSIEFAIQELESPDSLIINELPGEVNKFGFQYLPVLTVDNRALIFTARANDQSDEDILQSTFDGQNWSEAQPISEIINSPYNEGACTVSADGRTLIFTSCEGRRSYGNCDLYISVKMGENWSRPKNLGKKVNSAFWDSQPTLSADGKTLYFVSTRSGGIGGRDIWITHFKGGNWSLPENLGSRVNTKRDETTPFIHSNNETLFFSSDGHVGMGGFDLLKASKTKDGWQNIENLGYPINTFQDEVSLFITADGGTAYFAKEEKLGTLIQSSKLVSYAIPEEGRVVSGVTYVTGVVRDAKTNAPLKSTLELVDLSDQANLFRTESDSLTGKYFLVLPSGSNFAAFIEREGYLFEDVSFTTSLRKPADTVDIFLHPLEVGAKLVLENIYFAFDSDELNQKSTEELNRIVNLLNKYPSISIEISGHTDNVGSYKYNKNLSERRAKKIYDSLIASGIQSSFIKYSGFADSFPI
ncbi:MAG: OmpA family protein, partial [Cytophagales bacterium]|nr:OmpA family protein [Cytophagales bacterium]